MGRVCVYFYNAYHICKRIKIYEEDEIKKAECKTNKDAALVTCTTLKTIVQSRKKNK